MRAGAEVAVPTLLLVSGAPGSGKTQLSHLLVERLGLYRVCKAEIARGLDATDPTDPTNHDRGWSTYWDLLESLVTARVSVLADQTTWRGQCDPIIGRRLLPLAELRIVHCVSPNAEQRWLNQLRDGQRLSPEAITSLRQRMAPRRAQFELPLELDRPVLRVDTSDGYSPGLAEIVAFVAAN